MIRTVPTTRSGPANLRMQISHLGAVAPALTERRRVTVQKAELVASHHAQFLACH